VGTRSGKQLPPIVKRRDLIAMLGGAAIASTRLPIAHAQQADRTRRIGVFMGYPDGDVQAQANMVALRQGLQRLGWTEGRNIRIDLRWAGDDPGKARAYAKELIEFMPDVIVPSTNQVTAIVQQEARTIPIVFVFVGDPIGSGFAASLAQPGANLTGFANFENSIGAKWLEILREIVPHARRVGFLLDPEAPPNVGFLHAAQAAAQSFGVELIAPAVRDGSEIERAVAAFGTGPNDGFTNGLIVAPHAVTLGNRELIAALAARHRLPAVYSDRYFAESGGLVSFGNDTPDLFRRAASYVDRILKGAKPANLPVQLPTKFEMIINLKTAKALGLAIPPTLVARADKVIE
jgi:putative tryptophan/tyrosine transport system substrate-binding protein